MFKLNTFLFFRLPSAFWSGVRVISLSDTSAQTKVKLNWFNTNPFGSLFWAGQGMGAAMSTGILIMKEIRRSGKSISMLVVQNKASFSKKAKGKILFSCQAKDLIKNAVEETIATKEGVTFWLHSTGVDSCNDLVSSFEFEWSIKLKSLKNFNESLG